MCLIWWLKAHPAPETTTPVLLIPCSCYLLQPEAACKRQSFLLAFFDCAQNTPLDAGPWCARGAAIPPVAQHTCTWLCGFLASLASPL